MKKIYKIGLMVFAVVVISASLEPYISNSIKYSKAVKLMEDGNYSEAGDMFFDLELNDFRNSEELLNLCNAHESYDEGRIDLAKLYIDSVNLNILSKKSRRIEKEFIERIDIEIVDYVELKDKEQEEYENKVKTGVPFVGMYEKDIDDTILGKHTSIENQYLMFKGKEDRTIINATIYYFKDANFEIFSAKCKNGKVIGVTDNRDKYNEYLNAKEKESKNYHSGNNALHDPMDDYSDLDDYDDPEDYYYDHWDEYDCYDDAEDDWEEYMSNKDK